MIGDIAKTHPPPPSLGKRRGETALPSLSETEELGVSFLNNERKLNKNIKA